MKKLLLAVIAIAVSASLAFGGTAQSTSTSANRNSSNTPSYADEKNDKKDDTTQTPSQTADETQPDGNMKKEEEKLKKDAEKAIPQAPSTTLAQKEEGVRGNTAALFVAEATTPATPDDKDLKQDDKKKDATSTHLLADAGATTTPATPDDKKDASSTQPHLLACGETDKKDDKKEDDKKGAHPSLCASC
jgi:hypothetical protein